MTDEDTVYDESRMYGCRCHRCLTKPPSQRTGPYTWDFSTVPSAPSMGDENSSLTPTDETGAEPVTVNDLAETVVRILRASGEDVEFDRTGEERRMGAESMALSSGSSALQGASARRARVRRINALTESDVLALPNSVAEDFLTTMIETFAAGVVEARRLL